MGAWPNGTIVQQMQPRVQLTAGLGLSGEPGKTPAYDDWWIRKLQSKKKKEKMVQSWASC